RTDYHQGPVQSLRRGDGEIESLVRSQCRHHDVERLTLDRCGAVELGIDRRIDDGAIAAVAVADALLNGFGDGDEVRDGRGGAPVPVTQAAQDEIEDACLEAAAEVRLAHVPGVAHGGEAV